MQIQFDTGGSPIVHLSALHYITQSHITNRPLDARWAGIISDKEFASVFEEIVRICVNDQTLTGRVDFVNIRQPRVESRSSVLSLTLRFVQPAVWWRAPLPLWRSSGCPCRRWDFWDTRSTPSSSLPLCKTTSPPATMVSRATFSFHLFRLTSLFVDSGFPASNYGYEAVVGRFQNRRFPRIDGASLNNSIAFAQTLVDRMSTLENNIANAGVELQAQSPAEKQYWNSYPSADAFERSIDAILATKASSYLMHQNCRR